MDGILGLGLEETTIAILRANTARPLLLTEPVGAPPLATVPDAVDRVSEDLELRPRFASTW